MESDSVVGQFFACANLRIFAEDCRAGRFQTLSPTCPFQEKWLRIFGSPVSVACEHKYWFVFPTSCEYICEKRIERCEEGSNLRGKFPLDFKSNALTTRPSQLFWRLSYLDVV